MTLGELVAAVRAEHDASQAQVEGWANERYRRMVGESLWRAVTKTVGTTISGQQAYPVDTDLLDLRLVYVNGVRYDQVSPEKMLEVTAGAAWLVGDGVYSQEFDSSGTPGIALWPIPSVGGQTISALTAYEPADLGTDDSPIFPSHLHSYWRDGVIADAYVQLDGRWDLAGPHEQRFELGIVKLERLRNSRVGGGPVQVRVRRP